MEQDKMLQDKERPPAAIFQRLRRVSRQITYRSQWGSTMTRRWRSLLRRLGGYGKAADVSQR